MMILKLTVKYIYIVKINLCWFLYTEYIGPKIFILNQHPLTSALPLPRHLPLTHTTNNTPPQAGIRLFSQTNFSCLICGSPLLKMSATFSSDGTYENKTVPSETLSLIKCTWISMCLDLAWNWKSLVRPMAAWLSQHTEVGLSCGNPRHNNRFHNQVVLPRVRSSQVRRFFARPWLDQVRKFSHFSDPDLTFQVN